VSNFEDVMMSRLRGDPTPSRVETIKRDLAKHGVTHFLPQEWDEALIGYSAPEPLPLYELRKLIEIRMKAISASHEQQKDCENFVAQMLTNLDPEGSKFCVAVVYGHIR
jgi:hypothetical protein